MLPRLTTNKYINSAAILILASASLHLLILTGQYLYTGDWYFMNFFNMTGLTAFFPFSFNNFWGNFAGIIVPSVIFAALVAQHE